MEKVLCIERNLLPDKWLETETSLPLNEDNFYASFSEDSLLWVDRSKAEVDFNNKQLIPYVIVKNININAYACYPRQGSENRLHGLWSAGIGGHVNSKDKCSKLQATLSAGVQRELKEEFTNFHTKDISFLQFKGVINEEHSEVGKVHLGIVYELLLSYSPEAGDELKGMRWVSEQNLSNYKLELWSKLALKLCK